MESIRLEDYVRPLRRWWWLLAATTLVATAASFVMVQAEPRLYRARATLMVGASLHDPNPNSGELYLAQQLVTTYVDLAQRESVRQPVREQLGLAALPPYTARQVPATQLMELAVLDSDPLRAQAVAQALVDQLMQISPAGAQDQKRTAFVDQELDSLQASITETKGEVKRRQGELAQMFSARQIADAQTQISALETKLTSLQGNYTSLLATSQKGAVNTFTLIEPPTPGAPVDRGLTLKLATAAAIGLLLAAGGAYVIEYLDNSFKNADEVKQLLGLPTLAAIPDLPTGKEGRPQRPYMLEKSQSAPAESFRVLRTNLQFTAVAHSLRRLLITSALPQEGKSIICANLAVAVAQAGSRVLLIDCDLHRPSLHRAFGLVNSVGLTTALLDPSTPPEQYVQPTALSTLAVLTTGPLPPNAAELLGSQRMSDLLDRLQSHVDLILIDTPPTTLLADAVVLTALTDSLLLVVEIGRTPREIVKRTLTALQQVQSDVLGVVLNRMPARGSGYYYYAYGDGYYQRTEQPDGSPPAGPAAASPPRPVRRFLGPKQAGD